MTAPTAQRPPRLKIPSLLRRTLVVVQVLTALVFLLYWHNAPPQLPAMSLVAALRFSVVVSVVYHGIFVLLYLSIDRLESRWVQNPFRARPGLDERQLELRGRAHYIAYLLLGLMFFAYLIVPPADSLHLLWRLAAAVSLYGTLPTAVTAWLEPDPLPDDRR